MTETRILRLARLLRIATILGMIASLGVAVILVGVVINIVFYQTPQPMAPYNIDIWAELLLSVLSLVFVTYALDRLRRLFSCYMQGEIVTSNTASMTQGAGIALFWSAIIEILLEPVHWFASQWTAEPTAFSEVSPIFSQIGFLFAAGVLMVIGWVLSHAAEMAEENKAFI